MTAPLHCGYDSVANNLKKPGWEVTRSIWGGSGRRTLFRGKPELSATWRCRAASSSGIGTFFWIPAFAVMTYIGSWLSICPRPDNPVTQILLGLGASPVHLLAKYANRHGLIAGATGTGKSVSLMVLAEGFSRLGVPV